MIGSLFFVILTSLKLLPFENKNKSHFILYSAHLIVTLQTNEDIWDRNELRGAQ